jgi:hypothetical protein
LPDDLRIPLEEFCQWWGREHCELWREQTPHRVDPDFCESTEARTCMGWFVARWALSFAEGRLVYHPEYREVAMEDMRNAPPMFFTSYSEFPNFRAIFQGTVPNGEPCFQDESYVFPVSECADGFCEWGVCPGTCLPYPAVGARCDGSTGSCGPRGICIAGACEMLTDRGEACDAEVDVCPPPFKCRTIDDSDRCELAAELGETCVRTEECRAGACHEGRCELSAGGELCARAVECQSDLTCLSGVCAPRIDGADQPNGCSSDRECVEEQMCLNGDLWSGCGQPVRLGTGCNLYQGCPRGLVCFDRTSWNGVCSPPGELGDSCDGESCMPGTGCVGYDFEAMTFGTCQSSRTLVRCDPTP